MTLSPPSSSWKECLALVWAEERQVLRRGETWGLKPLSNKGQPKRAEKLRSQLIQPSGDFPSEIPVAHLRQPRVICPLTWP